MTERETQLNQKELFINSDIFPIRPKIIEDYFQKLPNKDPVKYKDFLSFRIENRSGHDPCLSMEVIGGSNTFLTDFKQFDEKNYFYTGGHIMHKILVRQAESHDFTLPIVDVKSLGENERVVPYRKTKLSTFQDFDFLKTLNSKDKKTLDRREKYLHDLLLLANEEPDIYQRLQFPDNPSMLVGASYVYSRYREIFVAANTNSSGTKDISRETSDGSRQQVLCKRTISRANVTSATQTETV